jgi:hypothetical protein
LQGKSDDILLFLNDIRHINKMLGFFGPSVQKILAFQYYGSCRGDQRVLAIPRRFG